MFVSLTTFLHGGLCSVLYVMFGRFCFTRRDEDVPLRARTALGLHFLLLSLQSLLRCINMLWGGDIQPTLAMFCSMFELAAIPTCLFVLLELTRIKHVRLETVAYHYLPWLLLVIGQALHCWLIGQNLTTFTLPIAYWLTIVWALIYGLFQTSRVVRASKRYASEVDDIYADTDGLQLDWADQYIKRVGVICICYMVLVIGIGSFWAIDIYLLVSMGIWVSLSNFVDRMRNNSAVSTIEEEEKQIANEESEASLSLNELKGDEELMPELHEDFVENLHAVCFEQGLFKKDGLTREEVARKMFTNHTYLSNNIKAATGKTFHEYIRDMRIEHACKLLVETHMDLEEIAFECGYRHKASFYRVFVDKMKCTPKEYRARMDKIHH